MKVDEAPGRRRRIAPWYPIRVAHLKRPNGFAVILCGGTGLLSGNHFTGDGT
jgi:hypothetical protein